MTKIFDDIARKKLLEDYHKPDLSTVRIKDIEVKQIPCKVARGYIAAFHYSHTMPDSSKYIYGAYVGGKLSGVCVFGMGCGKNQYLAVLPDIQNGEYIELTRLWLEDSLPHNSESYFISKCLKMLPKEIKLVVSFSDEKQNHVGYIYQATNFIYLGRNGGGKMLVAADGLESHPRLLGIYRMRHPEYKDYTSKQLMNLLGFNYVEGGVKHKYVFTRDKKLRKQLERKQCSYPKIGEINEEVESSVG